MLLLPHKCLIFASILPALFFLVSSAGGNTGNGMNVLLIVCDDLNDFEGVFGGLVDLIAGFEVCSRIGLGAQVSRFGRWRPKPQDLCPN